MSKFKIDFFELCFLAETCIPPRPIARSMFWDKLINEYYYQLSGSEREKLFGWITKNNCFDLSNEDCNWFYDRYNPDNQYQVKTLYEGKEELNDCFLHNGKYHINKSQSVYEKYIIDAVKKK
jgi:hypothetical protein